jgi:hypothetical protein
VTAAWTALRAAWADEDAHGAFLDLCADQGCLGDAARLYAAAVAAAPADAVARAGLERVRARALSALTVAREARNAQWVEGARKTWFWFLVVLAVATIVGFAIFWLTRRP